MFEYDVEIDNIDKMLDIYKEGPNFKFNQGSYIKSFMEDQLIIKD